jgi:hypothetical protein
LAEEKNRSQNKFRGLAFRIAKASAKAILVYLLYFLVASLFTPFFGLVPGLVETIEIFVTVYIVLMILGDLAARTVFGCFFNFARTFFVLGYLVFSIGDGSFNVVYENFSLTLNLTLFYAFAALLSMLGVAMSVMQAVHFMSERAESGLKP